jgi:hypothetical protein
MAFSIIAAIATAATFQAPPPVLWLDLKGAVLVAGRSFRPKITPGARGFRSTNGFTYDFDGKRGGVLLPDLEPLKLGRSITVATWIYARSYVNDGPGAQILFRGDDRSGLDPYDLVIHGDGTINFHFCNEQYEGMNVKAELPLNEWIHVTASLDAESGAVRMYLNGDLVAYARSSKRPFLQLDASAAPGIGIGNVQNHQGIHNQPFNGMLADLRLYDRVVDPEDAGFDARLIRPRSNPPLFQAVETVARR